MNRFVRGSFLLALTVCALAAMPATATDPPPSTAQFDLWYVLSVADSTDSAYSAAFGVTSITGRLSSGIVFNGVSNPNAKYATLKFYRPSLLPDYDGVASCVRKALTVAAAQVAVGPTPMGRNAGLVVKVTGDVRLNEGNGGFDGGANLTIIEVRSLRSIACQATFNFPDTP